MSQAVVALINTLAQVSVILEVMVPLVAVNIPNVPANLDTHGTPPLELAPPIVVVLVMVNLTAPMAITTAAIMMSWESKPAV